MDKACSKVFLSRSPAQTKRFAAKLARALEPGDVLALTGEIGSGKTTFVQGLAGGLEVPEGVVASPSFVLVREYQGRMPIFHADLFRLKKLPEAATVGLEEYYDSKGVTVIEWANRIPGVLPEEFLEIRFTPADQTTRKISILPHGQRYEKRNWPHAPGR